MHGSEEKFDRVDAGLTVPGSTEKRSQKVSRPLQHFAHAVLLSVSRLGFQAFPAEVARQLTKSLDRHVSLAQVFVCLERLEDRGLVSSQETEPERVRGGRRRRVFRLEASGEHALRETAATYRRMSSELNGRTETTDGSKERKVAPAF
jgi:PadR family transcriptional regulator PadR